MVWSTTRLIIQPCMTLSCPAFEHFIPERILLNLLPIMGAFSAQALALRHDNRLFAVFSLPLTSVSICPDKNNASLDARRRHIHFGHLPLPTFCSYFTYIPVVPTRDECNNTYPRS